MNYQVYADGMPQKMRTCKVLQRPYHAESLMEYVMFPVTGTTEVEILSEMAIHQVTIRPKSSGVQPRVCGNRIALTFEKPAKLSVEINGSFENNLMIFTHNPCREEPTGENRIVIRKGEPFVGTLRIQQDHTTVYLEDGAVLEGNIYGEDCDDVTICGFGKICMERYSYEMRKDFARSIDLLRCTNVKIRDIVIDDSNDWSLRVNGCENVLIENVKIFGCRGNSDGIDVCGSRNVLVQDIFTRVWDDSFVVKALGTGNVENVCFRNSVLWNDFARPMEVGVELRADAVRQVRFENIDVIHSTTGYPLMGIHHGDHARVSDILFRNIRIEDAPGAQLFDIRITHSVWNRDTEVGDIRDITFSDIFYLGAGSETGGIQLSNSRVEGLDEQHDIKGVRFHNICLGNRTADTPETLGLDIYRYVKDVSVTADLPLEGVNRIAANMEVKSPFVLEADGMYRGTVLLCLTNTGASPAEGTGRLAVAPKNMAEEQAFVFSLDPGEMAEYEFFLAFQPGKYACFLKSTDSVLENRQLFLDFPLCLSDEKTADTPIYRFKNYYGTENTAVQMTATPEGIMVTACLRDRNIGKFTFYTALPAPAEEGEVAFSVEETDFGEVCALLWKEGNLVPAPQLRCPAEITYVFHNQPKVGEVHILECNLQNGVPTLISFAELGLPTDVSAFILEISADTEQTRDLRYPYTLFHSTAPGNTAHMFGRVNVKKRYKGNGGERNA